MSVTGSPSPGKKLRDAWARGPVPLPGVCCPLVAPDVMAAKIRAAVAARRDPDFVLIARTDARGVNGFADAVRRARLYLDSGADAVFPEALETADEFAAFAKEVPAPLLANMTE